MNNGFAWHEIRCPFHVDPTQRRLAAVSRTLIRDIAYVVRIDSLRMTPLIVDRSRTDLARAIHPDCLVSAAINRLLCRFHCAARQMSHSPALLQRANLSCLAVTARSTVALLTASTVVL